ncbi:MAG TPA: DoxX family membrane protein [Sphingomicrobium sp.]|nr:DoxX family membrane protein [Sphingomicrobium sp.]
MMTFGIRVYGLGAVALGLVGLAWGDFALQWQPVPDGVPGRTVLAYATGAALMLAGAVLFWRRTTAFGAAALTALYAAGVVLLHGPRVAAHPLALAEWSGAAEQLVLVAGGLIAYASWGKIDPALAARLSRLARLGFGACLLVFGAAHFLYLEFTAAMVPKWIPPGQMFWACATGAAHIAAGLAILSGVQARLAAMLITAMFAGFSILLHIPNLLADPASHLNWVINAINLALTGAAWVVADSLASETEPVAVPVLRAI